MSHRATSWAFAQRGLRPSTKIVLLHLADRHNPDHGCFPSQARLADDCELSRSSINRALEELEEAGLIRREERKDPKSGARLSTRYRLGFEMVDKGQHPLSQNDTPPVPDCDSPCLASDTAPVPQVTHEPVRGTRKRNGKGQGAARIGFSEGWEPDDELRRWAWSEGFTDYDIEHEAKLCIAWHESKGTRFADLGKAWKSWMLKAKQFRTEEAAKAGKRAPQRRSIDALLAYSRARNGAREEIS